MNWKYRVVRDRDYRSEGFAQTEQGARHVAIRLANHEGEPMRVLPECALIGEETLIVPNDPRIDPNSGAWLAGCAHHANELPPHCYYPQDCGE